MKSGCRHRFVDLIAKHRAPKCVNMRTPLAFGAIKILQTNYGPRGWQDYGSGARKPPSQSADGETVSYPNDVPAMALTKEQCKALLRVFGKMAITQVDRAIMDPVYGHVWKGSPSALKLLSSTIQKIEC